MKIARKEKDFLVLRDNNYSGFLFGVLIAAIGAYAILVQRGNWEILGVLFGSAFILVGAYLFAKAKTTTIRLNKKGVSVFSSWSILKREKQEIQNSEIKEIRLEKSLVLWNSWTYNRWTYYSYPIVFALKDGNELSFEFGAISVGLDLLSFAGSRKEEEVKSVADFIGVPFKGGCSMDISDMSYLAEHEIGKRLKKGK